MAIDASYHIYKEVSSVLDDSEKSDVDRLLHVTSAFQFLYDLILALVGLGYLCNFQVDYAQIFDNFLGLFEVKDSCSKEKLFQIVQSESNYIEIGENIYQIYKELDDWEASFETGYNIGTSAMGIIIILEKTYETYLYLECQDSS